MKSISLDKAIDLVGSIRYILNTRVKVNRSIKKEVNYALNMMAADAYHIILDILESDKSEGPPLSSSWMDQKDRWWNGRKWYVVSKQVATQTMNNPSMAGLTMQVPKPPWAHSSSHKNAFTGFMHDNLSSWRYRKGKVNKILYGFKTNKPHPVSGIDLFTLATMIHVGGGRATRPIPARPFLDAQITIDEMVKMVGKRLITTFDNVIK